MALFFSIDDGMCSTPTSTPGINPTSVFMCTYTVKPLSKTRLKLRSFHLRPRSLQTVFLAFLFQLDSKNISLLRLNFFRTRCWSYHRKFTVFILQNGIMCREIKLFLLSAPLKYNFRFVTCFCTIISALELTNILYNNSSTILILL